MKTNKEMKQMMKKAVITDRGRLIAGSAVTLLLGGVSLFGFLAAQAVAVWLSAGLHAGRFETAGVVSFLYIILAFHLLAAVTVGGCVELGYDRAVLMRIRQEPAARGVLFYYKPIWFQAMTLRVLMAVKATLWFAVLFVPGIAAVLNYSLAPYLMAQNPHITPPEAIKTSKYLMRGYKVKLFLLLLSFLDEIIISILALGIPFIYVIPRIKTAIAVFYRERVALHDREVCRMTGISMNGEIV
ncbi:DUF975 family protein [Anaerovoracaceae bacterium 42-11]